MNNYWENSQSSPAYDMIVFCHLRWDFVYQRPQHLISRMSKKFKILVIEEPIGRILNEDNKAEIKQISDSLHILQPRIDHLEELVKYLKIYIKDDHYPIAWFYSAAFVSVLDEVNFETLIYDCMDELTLFKGASSKLIEQEKYLLSIADIVFTGGKSLFESKNEKHHNVHCFPSSIDTAHFSKALEENVEKPNDLEDINLPIIGYFGVIDERIDLDLIKNTAQLLPDHAFVMIGPICKIREDDLPRAKNIYYLGMKSYGDLPNYLRYFDFSMMPFALNDATKFISPTKTLEYMCAMKPIISTRIKDVERDYSNCVNLVDNAADFCNAVKYPMENYQKQYKEILEKTSWDQTAYKMKELFYKITS